MVRLRGLEPGDIDAVHALISRMDVVRHMLLPLCSRDESEKFLRDSLLEEVARFREPRERGAPGGFTSTSTSRTRTASRCGFV
jgi:hypothetical protein